MPNEKPWNAGYFFVTTTESLKRKNLYQFHVARSLAVEMEKLNNESEEKVVAVYKVCTFDCHGLISFIKRKFRRRKEGQFYWLTPKELGGMWVFCSVLYPSERRHKSSLTRMKNFYMLCISILVFLFCAT